MESGTIMSRSIIARGRFSDPQHIELTEPVSEIRGDVEVLIRQLPKAGAQDVFDLIAGLPPGSRSKADIDQQIREERLPGSTDESCLSRCVLHYLPGRIGKPIPRRRRQSVAPTRGRSGIAIDHFTSLVP
jgi:hypothetical protein